MLVYIIELRRRLLWVISFFFVFFLLFYYTSETILNILISPLRNVLMNQEAIIATNITASLIIPITLAANMACLITIPYLLYHLWSFAAPGLYQREKHELPFLIGLSISLFVLGILFCFYWILPYMFQLLTKNSFSEIKILPDITNTLNFITRMLLIFGCSFQVPLVCLILAKLKIVSLESLNKIRPYIIVLAFIIGMLLTPPDVLSQIMLAIPLCLLFEAGVLLVRLRS